MINSAALRSVGAVLFAGSDAESARVMQELREHTASGALVLVRCDADDSGRATCARSGVTSTPMFVTQGGVRVEGASLKDIDAALGAPRAVASALGMQGAVLYGREGCVWTRRQKAVLGLHLETPGIEYVQCDTPQGSQRCAAAGIEGVPSWVVGGGPKRAGFLPLAALEALAAGGSSAQQQR